MLLQSQELFEFGCCTIRQIQTFPGLNKTCSTEATQIILPYLYEFSCVLIFLQISRKMRENKTEN